MADSSWWSCTCCSTRSRSRPARSIAPKSSSPSGSTEWTPVTPSRCASRCASASAGPISSGPGSGRWSEARRRASSSRMPVGSPVPGSRTIRPPGGSAVAAVIPQRRRAAVFNQAAWRSWLSRSAGRPGTTRSSASRVGKPPQRLASHPCPSTQPSPPAAAMRASAASSVGASSSRIRRRASAQAVRWTCASVSPGVTVAPWSRSSRAPGEASGRTSASVPSAATRPSRTSSASAVGPPATAWTRAPMIRTSPSACRLIRLRFRRRCLAPVPSPRKIGCSSPPRQLPARRPRGSTLARGGSSDHLARSRG
jgi:hypothetical protein